MRKINITYTEEASRLLSEMEKKYLSAIEDIIFRRKYVPGEDTLEINQYDLMSAEKVYKLNLNYDRKNLVSIYTIIFVILGSLSVLVGSLYDRIVHLFYVAEPIQLIVIMAGFIMILYGFLITMFLRIIKLKRRRNMTIRNDIEKGKTDYK